MRTYLNFWRNCFNFKGKTSRRDFWVSGIMFNLFGSIINISEAIILMMKYYVPAEQAVRGTVYMIYTSLGLVALSSMAVRRLRDGGYLDRSWWKFFIPIVGFARLSWCLFIEKSASEDDHL